MSNESIIVYTPKDQQGELSASDNSEFSRTSKETRQTQTYSVITTGLLKIRVWRVLSAYASWLAGINVVRPSTMTAVSFYCIKDRTVFTVVPFERIAHLKVKHNTNVQSIGVITESPSDITYVYSPGAPRRDFEGSNVSSVGPFNYRSSPCHVYGQLASAAHCEAGSADAFMDAIKSSDFRCSP